jgi:basic membrane protein A
MQQRRFFLLSVLLVLAMVMVACQGSSTPASTATPAPVATEEVAEEVATEEVAEEEATEEVVEEEATEEVAEEEATEEVVEEEATEEVAEVEATEEVVEEEVNDEFAALSAAIDAAGLNEGTYTVFVPAEGDLTDVDVLQAHTVEGEFALASLEDGQVLTTLAGTELTVSVTEEGVSVNGASVARGDLGASNGIVHVLEGDFVAEETAEAEATEAVVEEATEEAVVEEEATEEVAEVEGEEVVAGLITSVCLVTDQGGIDDGNFNALANNGMQRASADFGLQATVIESSVAADYAPNIQSCIESGANVVVTVGFLMEEGTLAAATANPEVYFIAVDQAFTDQPANLVGTIFREDQAGFLVGVMAGLLTETNTIAGVYGIDVPAVVKFRNGYEQGARYANPEITVLGQYTDSFVNAALGATIAEQFIGEGADVIFGAGGATGTGGIQYAAAEGVKVIGVDQDEYYSNFDAGQSPGAENLITSALKSVDVGVYNMIAGLVGAEGFEFLGGANYMLEAANDGIGFAPAHDADIPAEVTAQVEATFELLKAGELETGVDPATGALIDAEEAGDGE